MNYKELLKTAKKYIKKPIPVKAVQMKEEFEVETLEGTMKGKAGDYLIEGVKGELYPCNKEIFEETYEEVDKYLFGLIQMNDNNKTLLNLDYLAKYFLRIFDNNDSKLTIEISVNGYIHKFPLYYDNKKDMLKDKESLQFLLGLTKRRLLK